MRHEVGRIVAAQGLKGELRLLLSDDAIPLKGRELLVEGEATPRRVVRERAWHAGRIVALSGIEDRGAAEAVAGRRLLSEEGSSPRLEEGRYWVHELLGFEVCDEEGTRLGVLEGVEAKPAQDIWVAVGPRGTYLIPAVRATVLGVDQAARRITVRGGGVLGPDAPS